MAFTGVANTADSIDYTKLAGPYFYVYLNGSTRSLPEWLAKQIKSIEITEVKTNKEPLDMAILTVIDGYENVDDKANSRFNANIISGRPGNILDLTINDKNQIRVLTQQELNARKQAYVNQNPTETQIIATPTFTVVIEAADVTPIPGAQLLTLQDPIPDLVNGNIFLGHIAPNATTLKGVVIQQPALNQIVVTGFPRQTTGSSISVDVTLQNTKPLPVPTTKSTKQSNAKFLFQEGNIVDIEWGYQTDSRLKRKMRFVVQFVEYDAPESSTPEAKIYCVPQIIADLGKLRPTVGVTFKKTALTDSGNNRNMDITAGEIVKAVADSAGYASVISTIQGRINYDDRKPSDFLKTITKDETIHEYLGKLAWDTGHHYLVGYNFKTGKNTIFFLSDEDYSKYATFNFVWKGPNTIMMSYHIRSDFSRLHAGATATPDPVNGDVKVTNQEQANLTYDLSSATQLNKSQISTPVTQSVDVGLKTIFKHGVTGVPLYAPIDQPNAQKTILDKHLSDREDAILMSGTMLGHPFVSPCVANFLNIGLRYSGRYELIRVKHIIDSGGYKIEYDASTNTIADSLVPSNKNKGDKDPANQNYVIDMRKNQLTTLAVTPSDPNAQQTNVPNTGSADTAANFNKTFEQPGKVKYTSSLGANNTSDQKK